jgi:hypothetical protein
MTRSIPKLAPDDIIEWPDGERGTVTWVSEDGARFRVEGLPSLLRTSRSGLSALTTLWAGSASPR